MRLRILLALVLLACFTLPAVSFSQSTQSLEEELTRKLNEINAALMSNRGQIQQLGKTNLSLQEEIKLLDKQIESVELQIQAGELQAQALRVQSQALQKDIDELQGHINDAKNKLAQGLSQLYQLDQRSMVEVILSVSDFSDFFNQVYYLRRLQGEVKAALNDLSQAKQVLDDKQEELTQRLAAQERLFTLQSLERDENEHSKEKKASLIEKNVRASNSLSQKSSALQEVGRQLREKLYVVKGLTKSVGLNEAHDKASQVAGKVHINPDFLMAVLKVESDIGNNVGGGHWQEDMHPRDRDAFLQITQKLRLDPDKMPVSSAPHYGWGGAMGPAQFLPSVWLSYENSIAALTGHNPPNPWDLEDAFAAAAIKLAANGANRQDANGEWEASMKYFAGSRWQNPAYSFYADRVAAVRDLIASQFSSGS